jgi:hypothetical protein
LAADRLAEFICDRVPSIPLPNIRMKLKDRWDIEFNEGNKWTTLRDWYGDLRQAFHCLVHLPAFHYCQKKINRKYMEVDFNEASSRSLKASLCTMLPSWVTSPLTDC